MTTDNDQSPRAGDGIPVTTAAWEIERAQAFVPAGYKLVTLEWFDWASKLAASALATAPATAAPACPNTGQCHPGFCPCSDARRAAPAEGSQP